MKQLMAASMGYAFSRTEQSAKNGRTCELIAGAEVEAFYAFYEIGPALLA
jgi:hypothetical protein